MRIPQFHWSFTTGLGGTVREKSKEVSLSLGKTSVRLHLSASLGSSIHGPPSYSPKMNESFHTPAELEPLYRRSGAWRSRLFPRGTACPVWTNSRSGPYTVSGPTFVRALRRAVGSHRNTVDSHPHPAQRAEGLHTPHWLTAVLESNLQKERILSALGLHLLLACFNVSEFLRNAINSLATDPTRPRSDSGLFAVEHVHPAQGLSLAYPPEVHLRGFEVLVTEDDLRDDLKGDPVPARIGG